MAITPEGAVKKQIKALLTKYNVYYAMPIGTMYGNSGVPDFLCCVNATFLAIEAKAGRGKTTALQDKNISDIHKAGGRAMVVNENNLDRLELLLKDLCSEDSHDRHGDVLQYVV